MKKDEKQKEMGIISNLITDMTLRGAPTEDLERAVRHSMVVIDAEKHKLDYKRSEKENGIQELKRKYQIRTEEDGTEKYGGASTLLSRRKQTVRIPERRGSVRIDKETGKPIYKESGRTYPDKNGKQRIAETEVSRISLMDDVRPLSSGTPQEELYATFSNSLKAMANKARKESVNMKGIQRDPAAAKEYAAEVASLNEKYQAVLANKPKERRAMIIANSKSRQLSKLAVWTTTIRTIRKKSRRSQVSRCSAPVNRLGLTVVRPRLSSATANGKLFRSTQFLIRC